MSHDASRMRSVRQKNNNSLLPSLNYKHIISSLVILLLVTTSSSQQQQQYECPSGCTCNELTLSARCESLDSLIKSYSAKHRRHRRELMPIKSLDLSANRLTKISNQLELLVNLTELDLSHNQLTQVHKLHFERLEKLDLSHNRITSAKLSKLPRNVVHLNLTHNEITYLPVDFMKLKKLRTLELSENPLNCTCDTLMVRNWIGLQSVWSSHAIVCAAPQSVKGQPWLQARQNDICIEQMSTTAASAGKYNWDDFDANDVMMGDQPAADDDDDGRPSDDDDYEHDDVDGKKDEEYEEIFDEDVKPTSAEKQQQEEEEKNDDDEKEEVNELEGEFIKVLPSTHETSTAPPTSAEQPNTEDEYDEGSGSEVPQNIVETEDDGSGSGAGLIPIIVGEEEPQEPSEEPPREVSEEPVEEHSKPDLGMGIFEDNTVGPSVQRGGVIDAPKDAEEVPGTLEKDATLGASDQIKEASTEDNTGTYILLAVIGILLVSLIIFVAMKNRQEKRQNRRRYDVEKNGATELQDMDKRLLGKPLEKNGNGKHAEQSPLINEYPEPKEYKPFHAPEITVDEPVQELPQKQKSQQSLYDNNASGEIPVEPVHAPVNGALPKSPDSEDEVFHPTNGDEPNESLNVSPEPPKRYSPIYSPTSPKSARYSPVYDEQGRVKIKLTETPKPKTPIIVNRTRSRAGDYVNTPN